MKNTLKLLTLIALFVFLLSGCSSSKRSMHNHGVNNRGFQGY